MFEEGSLLLPQLIVCFGSLFYVAQSAVVCEKSDGCNSYAAWAVACGSISLAMSLVLSVLTWFDRLQNALVQTGCAVFLTVWWAAGAGAGTFKAPFPETGNGYFAGWVAFMASASYLWRASEMSHSDVKARAVGAAQSSGYSGVLFIFFSSFVYMIAAATKCSDVKSCDDEFAWAVACAVIALVFSAALILISIFQLADLTPTMHCCFAAFFVLWYAAGAGVGTFQAPFVTTGNGYFSVWAAFLCSVWYFYEAYQRRQGNEPGSPLSSQEPEIVVSAQGSAFDAPVDGGYSDGGYTITSDQQAYQDTNFRPNEQI